MNQTRPTVVVTSVRPASFDAFLAAWRDEATGRYPWHELVLVEDGPRKTFEPPAGSVGSHLCRPDLAYMARVSGLPDIVPECVSIRDSAIKSFGFVEAYVRDASWIVALDDDCLPHPDAAGDAFVASHAEALFDTDPWTSTIPGRHVRGVPYDLASFDRLPVHLNVGLWDNVPDDDAPHHLVRREAGEAFGPTADFGRSRIMPARQYWPMCGMNLAFRPELLPLMYFPKMGDGVAFRRFDDIWCGVIAQRIMQHLGLNAAVGAPVVWHAKASNPMDNLVKEATGIRANQEFWRIVDAVVLRASTPLSCMREVGSCFRSCPPPADPELRSYLPLLGACILQWCQMLDRLGVE